MGGNFSLGVFEYESPLSPTSGHSRLREQSPIAVVLETGEATDMTPGSAFNWILALLMSGWTIFVVLAGRTTLKGGEVFDRDIEPTRFWIFVGGCGAVSLALLAQAVFRFR